MDVTKRKRALKMNNSCFNILKTSFCAILLMLLIAYLLCDMSMSLNDYLKMRRYNLVTGLIKSVKYNSDGSNAYIELKNAHTEYILNGRSVITESDTGKYAEILYHHIKGGGKRNSGSDNYIKQLSINRKIVWTDTPAYVIDIVFILFSFALLIYFISEIRKEIKQDFKKT